MTSVREWDPKEWTIVSWDHMDSNKGTIQGNNCLTSALQIICTDPKQNSYGANYQDAGGGQTPLANTQTHISLYYSVYSLLFCLLLSTFLISQLFLSADLGSDHQLVMDNI